MKTRSRITSLDEFYKRINELILRLKQEEFLEDSHKLDEIMHTAWTTSSELLGELTLTLRSMNGEYPLELNATIKDCYNFARHHRKILKLD